MVLEYIFGSIAIVSMISLIGAFTLSLNQEKLKKQLLLLVSFSVGVLLGDVFLHLLPETAKEFGFTAFTGAAILFAIIVFFVLENAINWHHHHYFGEGRDIHSFGYANLLGDALHNFLDGVVIAGSYMVSIPLGIATTFAVILHEIPQEIGDFGILLHSGFNVKEALKFNFLSALAAVVGGMLGLFFSQQITWFSSFLVPFTAGGFIYIAGTDLLPEVRKMHGTKSMVLQFLAITAGMAAMYVLLLVFE